MKFVPSLPKNMHSFALKLHHLFLLAGVFTAVSVPINLVLISTGEMPWSGGIMFVAQLFGMIIFGFLSIGCRVVYEEGWFNYDK